MNSTVVLLRKASLLAGILIGLSAAKVQAQFNLPLVTQYYTNPYLWNPAQAGGYDYPLVYLTYKDQWTGIQGHPTIASFTYNMPILSSSGIGINVYNDMAGFQSRTKAVVSFSQFVFINAEKQYISFGLSGGVINQRIDLSQVNGELNKAVDPVATAYNRANPFYPDLDFGIAYHFKGLDMDFVLPNLLKFTETNKSLSNAFIGLPVLFTSAGYNFPINEDLSLHPKVALRRVSGFGNLVTVSVMATYREALSIGVYYNTDKTITGSVGFMIDKNWDFNYAYTQNNSALQQFFGDTHEFTIGYHFSDGHQSRSSKNLLIKCPHTAN